MRAWLLPSNKQNSPNTEVRTSGWDNWRILNFGGDNSLGLSAQVVGVRLHLREKTNFPESRDPSSRSGRKTWSRSYELLRDRKSSGSGVVCVSETCWSLNFGVGVLTSPKGPEGSCLSAEGQGTILLHQIWCFGHLWPCSKIRSPPTFRTAPPKYLEHFEVLTSSPHGMEAPLQGAKNLRSPAPCPLVLQKCSRS